MLNGSWRTTAIGVLSGIIVCAGEIRAALDDDPATGFSWPTFVMGLGMMGLGVSARDNRVSSEEAGAK